MRLLMIAAALAVLGAPARAEPAEGRKPAAAKPACRALRDKAAHCPARGAPKARVSMPMISRCRDVVSHQITRCGGPNAEPVPAN